MAKSTRTRVGAPKIETRDARAAHQEITLFPARLPYHASFAEIYGINENAWRMLCDVAYPNATSTQSVLLVLEYCRQRRLDWIKKPVAIVPMWSKIANGGRGAMIDTLWPTIQEVRINAHRTGQYAGRDRIVWGPMIEVEFKDDEETIKLAVPEFGVINGRKIVQGHIVPSTGPEVYWLETYGKASRHTNAPNSMWRERPRGQLEKCAEAAFLRGLFPEEMGDAYIPEEMEGRELASADPRNMGPGGIAPEGRPARIDFKPGKEVVVDIPADETQTDDKPKGEIVNKTDGPDKPKEEPDKREESESDEDAIANWNREAFERDLKDVATGAQMEIVMIRWRAGLENLRRGEPKQHDEVRKLIADAVRRIAGIV